MYFEEVETEVPEYRYQTVIFPVEVVKVESSPLVGYEDGVVRGGLSSIG